MAGEFPGYTENPDQAAADKNKGAMASPQPEQALSTPEQGAMDRLVHAPWDATDVQPRQSPGGAMTGEAPITQRPNRPNQ